MMWDLPTAVTIDGTEYKIRNNCDYRVVRDVIAALNDNDLEIENRIECALIIFYENFNSQEDLCGLTKLQLETAVKEMFKIINNGEEETEDAGRNKPQLMDWEKDFKYIAPPVNHVLGYDIRTPGKYTHWWTFLGAYCEIGECVFATIVSIRNKKIKGKKLEKWEEEFYRENYKMINLPSNLSKEEEGFLNNLLGGE